MKFLANISKGALCTQANADTAGLRQELKETKDAFSQSQSEIKNLGAELDMLTNELERVRAEAVEATQKALSDRRTQEVPTSFNTAHPYPPLLELPSSYLLFLTWEYAISCGGNHY